MYQYEERGQCEAPRGWRNKRTDKYGRVFVLKRQGRVRPSHVLVPALPHPGALVEPSSARTLDWLPDSLCSHRDITLYSQPSLAGHPPLPRCPRHRSFASRVVLVVVSTPHMPPGYQPSAREVYIVCRRALSRGGLRAKTDNVRFISSNPRVAFDGPSRVMPALRRRTTT